MDYEELDEAEKERRRKDKIEYSKKKRFSAIFMTIACICEIIITLFIMLVALIAAAFIIQRVNLSEKAQSTIMTICLCIIFFGGLFVGFIIYKKLVCLVIEKFKLEDKLLDDVTMHYTKIQKDKEKATEEKKR